MSLRQSNAGIGAMPERTRKYYVVKQPLGAASSAVECRGSREAPSTFPRRWVAASKDGFTSLVARPAAARPSMHLSSAVSLSLGIPLVSGRAS